jgi:hypothetical protein
MSRVLSLLRSSIISYLTLGLVLGIELVSGIELVLGIESVLDLGSGSLSILFIIGY